MKREIRILENVDHPGIVKLYEAIETQTQVFLVMELMEGGSMHSFLKAKPQRRLEEKQARTFFRQIVSAIAYCHNRCISHRDIKLENILMNEDMSFVKLIDFGFSTCNTPGKPMRLFCGTPSYMAPEIVTKQEFVGAPADIWALGVLLVVILSGVFPFKSKADGELYKQISTGIYRLPDYISFQAKSLIMKLL